MKKTFLILICALYCFRATPQTGALYCNYGENKDHLIVCLYLFQDKSFKLKISDMCVEDLPSEKPYSKSLSGANFPIFYTIFAAVKPNVIFNNTNKKSL